DRVLVQHRFPALEVGALPVAVGAADVGHAVAGDLGQHQVALRRRRVVGVEQQGDALFGFGHGGTSGRCRESGTRPVAASPTPGRGPCHHRPMAVTRELTPARRLRSIFSGSVGNLVEWYDWYVYAAFSLYFAEVFFPGGDRTSQLLKTAAIFAVGFLMRPLGGWLLGRYADRHGRKAALLLSVWMMCSGSLLIALTPGYASIGIAAPVLLVLARLLQGLSVGGEYGTSATYLSEMASREHRGFWSSFQYVTLVMGHLLALGVLLTLQALLDAEQLRAWGWRIPFAIGALAALVAMWLRRTMLETESFVRSEADGSPAHQRRQGTLRLLLRHPRALLSVVGLTMGGTLAFYTYTTYV